MTVSTVAILSMVLVGGTARALDTGDAVPSVAAFDVQALPTPAVAARPIESGRLESPGADVGSLAASVLDWASDSGAPAPPAERVRPAPEMGSAVNSSWSVQVVSGVAYTSRETLDIYVPGGPGPHPTVVLVRGGPSGDGGRAYLGSFASELAASGLLVFNADYRDTGSTGGGYPAAFQDVACAIRYARAQAERYGGEGSMVTLVGHSLGGWVGSVVALNSKEFTGGCQADGSGRPDAFVGLAGNYDLDAGGGVGRDLSVFFDGSAAQTAAARSASDPLKYVAASKIPIRLVAGTADGTVDPSASTKLNALLVNRGWNVGLTLVPGANHTSILWTSYGGGSLGAIFSAFAAARSAADATDAVRGRLGQ
jgi:acetyl esterase/lipase